MPADGLSSVEQGAETKADTGLAEGRPFHEINRDLRTLLRREAKAAGESEHAAAILALSQLYGEIMRDRRLASSDTLQSYRVKVRSRLLRAQKDIERILDRRASETDRPYDSMQDRIAAVAASQLTAQLVLLANSGGRDGLSTLGPGSLGWFGGGSRRDYGPDLVALIQRTISPDSWDVNGGAGTIYYYWPWYALVVRNSAEVHRQIGGLRNGL
jgi:hypothetical protein